MTTLTAASGTSALSSHGGIWPAHQRRHGGPGAGPGWSLTAADVLRAVRQRLVLVLFVWTLIVGATIGMTVLWIQYWPEFRSGALVKVESILPVDVFSERTQGSHVTQAEMEALVKDQAVMVTSPDVLRDVLEAPE